MLSTTSTHPTADAGQNSAKHTPGPLRVEFDRYSQAQWSVIHDEGHEPHVEQAGVGNGKAWATARCYYEADALLYASAPIILAERDALKAENERLRELLREAGDVIHQIDCDWNVGESPIVATINAALATGDAK